MKEPWKDEPIIWKAFCLERKQYFDNKEIQFLFNNSRSMKEEFEWFEKGYLSHKGGSVS
jgi:hypothetical protein